MREEFGTVLQAIIQEVHLRLCGMTIPPKLSKNFRAAVNEEILRVTEPEPRPGPDHAVLRGSVLICVLFSVAACLCVFSPAGWGSERRQVEILSRTSNVRESPIGLVRGSVDWTEKVSIHDSSDKIGPSIHPYDSLPFLLIDAIHCNGTTSDAIETHWLIRQQNRTDRFRLAVFRLRWHRFPFVHNQTIESVRNDEGWRSSTIHRDYVKSIKSKNPLAGFNFHQYLWSFRVDEGLGVQQPSFGSLASLVGLPANDSKSENNCPGGDPFRPCHEYTPPWRIILAVLSIFSAGIILSRGDRKVDTICLTLGLIFFAGVMLLVGHRYYCAGEKNEKEGPFPFPHNCLIVPHKYLDLR